MAAGEVGTTYQATNAVFLSRVTPRTKKLLLNGVVLNECMAQKVWVPTATRMFKQLETVGVVTRQRSPHDERQVLVRLTDDGADRLAAMRTELRARQTEALSHFSPRERHELAAQLQGLADVIGDTVPQSDRDDTTQR